MIADQLDDTQGELFGLVLQLRSKPSPSNRKSQI